MGENKKYFWLKLDENFFKDKGIKKLRKIAGGDTYTIIYLKLALLTLKTGGVYEFEEMEETIIEEIALEIDEEVENVKVTIMFLMKVGYAEYYGEDIKFPIVENSTGSITQSSLRSRKSRANKQKALQSNTEATKGNTYIEKEKELYINKDINIKKEKTSLVEKQTKVIDELYINMANYQYNKLLEMNPNHKKPNFNKWADEFRKLVELDNRDINEVGNLMNWVYQDNFWKAVVLSPKKLREKYDQLVIKANRNIITQESFENKINRMTKEAMEMEMDF